MKHFNQTTHCAACGDNITIEISAWDNLGTLEEEMSAKDWKAQERFLADHRGHDLAQANEEK